MSAYLVVSNIECDKVVLTKRDRARRSNLAKFSRASWLAGTTYDTSNNLGDHTVDDRTEVATQMRLPSWEIHDRREARA